MAGSRGTETTFELTTIVRLEQQGYKHMLGLELERPHDEVVMRDLLRANLIKRYPEAAAISASRGDRSHLPTGWR